MPGVPSTLTFLWQLSTLCRILNFCFKAVQTLSQIKCSPTQVSLMGPTGVLISAIVHSVTQNTFVFKSVPERKICDQLTICLPLFNGSQQLPSL